MDIERRLRMDPDGGKPIISRVVAHGDRDLLARVGSDKSKLLTAQVWPSDMRHFRTHNAAWNEWVDPEHPPVRACVEAGLFARGLLVEIIVTAAR